MENKCLNANNISQYYCFYCISGEQTSFKNIMEFYQPQTFENIYSNAEVTHICGTFSVFFETPITIHCNWAAGETHYGNCWNYLNTLFLNYSCEIHLEISILPSAQLPEGSQQLLHK